MIDFIQYVKREGRERKKDLFGVPLLFFLFFFSVKENYRKSTYTVELSMSLLRMWFQSRN